MGRDADKASDTAGQAHDETSAAAEGTVAWESPILTKLPAAEAGSGATGAQDGLGGAHYS